MNEEFQILPVSLFDEYCKQIDEDLQERFDSLTDAEISTDTFSFYTSVSSVFSSKIEGEEIELDSYIKHKKFGVDFLPDYTRKIDDLYNAYIFSKGNVLNEGNIKAVHQLLTKHILANHQQVEVRSQNMYVSTPDGKIEYVAALPSKVKTEMNKLYLDIDLLLSRTRTVPSLNIYHDPSIPALSVVARILITLPYTHSQVPTTDTLAYNDRSLILMIFRWRWPLTNWIRRSF